MHPKSVFFYILKHIADEEHQSKPQAPALKTNCRFASRLAGTIQWDVQLRHKQPFTPNINNGGGGETRQHFCMGECLSGVLCSCLSSLLESMCHVLMWQRRRKLAPLPAHNCHPQWSEGMRRLASEALSSTNGSVSCRGEWHLIYFHEHALKYE